MADVTLIGTRLATVGTEFTFHGEALGCEGCPYRAQCLNLEEGFRYRVTSVRENTQVLDCALHSDGVRAVEVEPAEILVNVERKQAYAGSKASPSGKCPYYSCPSHEYCNPDGMNLNGEYRIQDIVGDPPHETCLLNRNLELVSVTQSE